MNNKPSNYSGLFKLFAYDKPDKTGTILARIGKISFALSFVGSICSMAFNDDGESSLPADIALWLFGTGFFVGIFMFITTGIYYYGREKGSTNFLSSAAHVLRNTFVYIFLPVIIITLLIVVWAIITKQPAIH